MFNIEWQKGNPKNLKGKVVVYAKFNSNGKLDELMQNPLINQMGDLFDGMLFAVYGTIDEQDFKIRFGEKKENDIASTLKQMFGGEEVPEQFKGVIEGATQMMNGLTKLIEGDETVFYAKKIDYNDVDLESGIDVIYLGEFDNPKTCVTKVNNVVGLYKIEIQEIIKKGKFSAGKKASQKRFKTYEDFKNVSVTQYLTATFLAPLTQAYQQGDFESEEVRELRKRLCAFFKVGSDDSPFKSLKDDVFDLENALEECNKREKGEFLSQLYFNKSDRLVQKLAAVHEGNYEKAAELKTELSKLNQKIKEYGNTNV